MTGFLRTWFIPGVGWADIMANFAIRDLPTLVGTDLGVSGWLLVTQDQVNQFADLVGDHAWMHVDVERAGRELGGTIAHGNMTLSLIAQMGRDIFRVTDMVRGVNYGWGRVRFINPVKVGKRIRLRQTIENVRPKEAGLEITMQCTVEIEDEGKPACVAERLLIVY